MRISRFVSVTTVFVLLLAVAAEAASANRLNVTNKNFRISFTDLAKREPTAGIVVSCPITMEGSFHANAIVKMREILIGYITRASTNNAAGCAGGRIFALNGVENLEGVVVGNSLPWHIQYISFRGTLPRLEGMRVAVIGASLLVEIAGLECLYRSTAARPWFGIFTVGAGGVLGFRSDETVAVPINGEEGFCPRQIFVEGSGTVTLLGNTQRITLTLI